MTIIASPWKVLVGTRELDLFEICSAVADVARAEEARPVYSSWQEGLNKALLSFANLVSSLSVGQVSEVLDLVDDRFGGWEVPVGIRVIESLLDGQG